jgi:hypothetical protein
MPVGYDPSGISVSALERTDLDEDLPVAVGAARLARWSVPLAPLLEAALLGACLAAEVAALLLVARNGLAPVQEPLTFGLVFWGWLLLFYGAIALTGTLAAWGLSRLTGRPWLAPLAVALCTLVFVVAALGFNTPSVLLFQRLEGPARFRWLAPAALLLSCLALLAQGLPARRSARRWLAALALAGGLTALGASPTTPAGRDGALEGSRQAPAGERLLVVAVDGADWTYMEPLIARGELPNLAALRRRGAWGELETLVPTRSPAIWTSVVTGRTPADHGVRDFVSPRLRGVVHVLPRLEPVRAIGFERLYAELRTHGQVHQVPANDTDRRLPAFWNIASAMGSPVNVVSWWATWPAEPVLGHIVSDALHQWPPSADGRPPVERLTHPASLYREIVHLVMRPEEMTLKEARRFVHATAQEYRSMLDREGSGIERELTYYYSYFETTRRVALDLIERGRARYGTAPDTLVYFRIVDKMCHASLADSELVEDRSLQVEARVRRHGRVVSSAYATVDQALGELVSAFGGGGNVIVLSDHGFELNRHKGQPANHKDAPPGIFVAAGPVFRPGRVDGLSVYSILPLLLHIKGFPVADDFAGRLEERVLEPGFLSRRPVRRVASYGSRQAPRPLSGDAAADAEALEHLRALGYLE